MGITYIQPAQEILPNLLHTDDCDWMNTGRGTTSILGIYFNKNRLALSFSPGCRRRQFVVKFSCDAFKCLTEVVW